MCTPTPVDDSDIVVMFDTVLPNRLWFWIGSWLNANVPWVQIIMGQPESLQVGQAYTFHLVHNGLEVTQEPRGLFVLQNPLVQSWSSIFLVYEIDSSRIRFVCFDVSKVRGRCSNTCRVRLSKVFNHSYC